MQLDFHYYATYCAAFMAGYGHEDCAAIAYSSQFVDCCSRVLLRKIGASRQAATTQLQSELIDAPVDTAGLQDITRIWASFHFLPGDLYAEREKRCSKRFLRKYRLICQPDSELAVSTVELAKGRSLQAAGLAMHVLADTWAHRNFAGTPSLAINNTNYHFFELIPDGDGYAEREIRFNHNPVSPDDAEKGIYTGSTYQSNENSIMNLGHGRAGHLPDYSWARYRYMPSWGDYREIVKDNPADYFKAFCQMVSALRYLRGDAEAFEAGRYDTDTVMPWQDRITEILQKRQLDSSDDWKALCAELSGQIPEDFDIERYQQEYIDADGKDKDKTFLGKFVIAAMAQKSMVTNRIYKSGSMLAGVSADYSVNGFRGIKDFRKLIEDRAEDAQDPEITGHNEDEAV